MLDRFLLVKDFEFDELNQAHKSKMIDTFERDKDNRKLGKGHNSLYADPAYTSIISNAFLNLVDEEFVVSDPVSPITTWIYVQNNVVSTNIWHNHVKSSTINAVFYINPPQEGGELQLLLHNTMYSVKPEKNKIYIFPYWMDHRPSSQVDPEWRISVNIEYMCLKRPILKKQNILW